MLSKLHKNCHIFTSNGRYFHHKLVLSICFVEKVPKLFQKITMQKITEVNRKEHKKSHFWRGLPCIFSVFSKIIRDGESEAILPNLDNQLKLCLVLLCAGCQK
jgi:hypothetical protein